MKITVSHSGKQHSYHLAKALLNLQSLDVFFTSSYVASPALQNYFIKSGNTYFSRRFEEGLGGSKVDANWRFELREIILRKLYGKTGRTQNAVYERDVNFDAYVAGKLPNRKADAFWGFQGSCHSSLQKANDLGRISLCELATAHVTAARRILGEESLLHPEWADSIDNLVFPAPYEKRLVEEPHIAKYAVAASAFTRQTLLEDGIAPEKILTLPLGFDLQHVPYPERNDDITKRPLRLLYAGTLTQRKGLLYLLSAMRSLKNENIELHCIGGIQGSGKALKEFSDNYIYHSPVSQAELFGMYGAYDALVLPTVFEGFGLVIVEAMAAGLPVITTPHSMGPELVRDNVNGWIVPIRDISALSTAIMKLRHKTGDEYLAMRQAARDSAGAYTWDVYAQRLGSLISGLK
ncbi:MAG: glycosyltransferase family 4 protein [Bacteroidota bacterium]